MLKSACGENPKRNIWNKAREWTGSGNFDICFCVTFDRHCFLFLEKDTE